MNPICPYCGQGSVPCTGADVYPHRPDLASKQFFRCIPCDAWVGTHVMDGKPLGTLANAKLRKLRNEVHRTFDPIWNDAAMKDYTAQKPGKKQKVFAYFIPQHRTAAYAMLSRAMDIPIEMCHIAMFNEDQCRKVIDLINSREIFRFR